MPTQENSKEVSIAMVTDMPIENEKECPSASTEPLGSNKINFSSLIDVRHAMSGSLDSAQPFFVQAGVTPGSVGVVSACLVNNKDRTPFVPTHGNGGANLWDEISEALSAKKAQLSVQDNWTKQEISGNHA